MKKISLIVFCLLLIFAMCLPLASCTKKEETTTTQSTQDTKAVDYNRAIALIEEGKYEEAKALFEKLGDYKDSAVYLSKFCYLPTWVYYNLIDKVGSYEYFFNENNLPSKYITHREGIDAYCDFYYYENGDIKQQAGSINGQKLTFDYTYNADGKRISAIYKVDGVLTNINTSTYDENGREHIYRVADADDNMLQQVTYTYDDKGNVILYDFIAYDSRYNYTINFEYTYDDRGNLIKKVCNYWQYDYGKQEVFEYTFDDNNRMTKKVLTYDDGSQDVWEYTYDEKGNMVKEVLTDCEGVVQYIEYQYVLFYLPTGLTEATREFFAGLFEEQL
jgi:YD repeat-containing protein